jgi:hypothetical protein
MVNKTIGKYVFFMACFLGYMHCATLIWTILKRADDIDFYIHDPSTEPYWLHNTFSYYIHYAYFVVTTTSTNGYGDVLPNKNKDSEIIFAMFVVLTGLIFMTAVISISNMFIKSFDEIKQKRRQKIQDFRHWFNSFERNSRAEFPDQFVKRLMAFFNFLYTSEYNNLLYDNQFFEELPNTISNELETEYAKAHGNSFQELFDYLPGNLCVQIIKNTRPIR